MPLVGSMPEYAFDQSGADMPLVDSMPGYPFDQSRAAMPLVDSQAEYPFDQSGYKVLALPQSIYAVAILAPQMDDYREANVANRCLCMWMSFNQAYLMLLCNFGLQIFLVMSVHTTVVERIHHRDDICGATFWVRLACTCIFSINMLHEVAETFSLVEWHVYMKRSDTLERLRLETNSDGVRVIANGLTRMQIAWDCIAILLPKLLVALWLWWAGAVFVATSQSNEDALLNSMGMVFIVQMDEYLYTVFTNQCIKGVIDQLPNVIVENDGSSRFLGLLMGNLVTAVLVLGISSRVDSVACVALD